MSLSLASRPAEQKAEVKPPQQLSKFAHITAASFGHNKLHELEIPSFAKDALSSSAGGAAVGACEGVRSAAGRVAAAAALKPIHLFQSMERKLEQMHRGPIPEPKNNPDSSCGCGSCLPGGPLYRPVQLLIHPSYILQGIERRLMLMYRALDPGRG